MTQAITNHRKATRNVSHQDTVAVPRVSPFLLKGFQRYIPRLLRKNFNAVRLASNFVPTISPDQPAICYINHPGWWDPILAFYLNKRFLAGRTIYAPIDKSALQQYPVFRKLGFYGLDMDSNDGAKHFLTVTRTLLEKPTTAIWMTPGGKFCDPRERTELQPGLSHVLANHSKMGHPDRPIAIIPIALEYAFWEERTPEALIQFGTPIPWETSESSPRTKSDWHTTLEDALADVQTDLAKKSIARDYAAFETLLDGSAGAGGLYDAVRKCKSLLGLGSFRARHRREETAPNQLNSRAQSHG